MFKKTFFRMIVLGTFTLALCFVLVSAQKARESAGPDCIIYETKMENGRPSSEFIIERLFGSVLFGLR